MHRMYNSGLNTTGIPYQSSLGGVEMNEKSGAERMNSYRFWRVKITCSSVFGVIT